ncbi:hypothetical protein LCGC14_0443990 [marine sediment metagenome]|uniref:Uncharacterized protein n=1 Tax=marine sediment metagenome TaxID=412755 RepID=A0A0F9SJI1_9ZZZZ
MPIRDTSKPEEVERFGYTAMAVGANETVLAQEQQGQIELVSSIMLPTKGAEQLEKIGCVLGPINEKDPLFREVTLPEGWKKERTDHSLYSKIVDAQGNERATVFYKAAHYDRDAFCFAQRRFHHNTLYPAREDRPEGGVKLGIGTSDSDEPLVIIVTKPWNRSFEFDKEGEEVIEAYMQEHAPDWQDYNAYWDELPDLPQPEIVHLGQEEEE